MATDRVPATHSQTEAHNVLSFTEELCPTHGLISANSTVVALQLYRFLCHYELLLRVSSFEHVLLCCDKENHGTLWTV